MDLNQTTIDEMVKDLMPARREAGEYSCKEIADEMGVVVGTAKRICQRMVEEGKWYDRTVLEGKTWMKVYGILK